MLTGVGESMHVPLYDTRSDYLALKKEIDGAIGEVLDSGNYVLGPQVESFEREFATYCGAKYAVGVGSGTAALALALRACGVKKGDEVITVPNTDMASSATITHCGAKVVFVDVEPHSHLMDPRKLESKITARTKAIVPVHLFGWPADVAAIQHIAAARNLSVIEDTALAVGAEYRGRKAGAFGDAGCMSFAPNKILAAIGNAGVVTTDRNDVAEEVADRMLSLPIHPTLSDEHVEYVIETVAIAVC
jgi:dTDP-4-amino-4,6-dideoxygalactose transaminase